MRLFTAIDLPAPVREALARLLDQLKPTARLRWSPVENLHITTKFIGEWPENRRAELESALRRLGSFDPIPIRLRGLGFFPNPQAPRVFWVGVEAGPGLAELARRTDEALARLGVPRETRPFSPHLTLARIKEPVPLAGLRQSIAQLETVDFGEFQADRFYLYWSELRPSGSVYTMLSEFPFAP